MSKKSKIILIVVLIVVISIAAYFYFTKKEKTIDVLVPIPNGGANNTGNRTSTGTTVVAPTYTTERWIIKSDKPQGRSCPMGQSTIWDPTNKKWVCAVRSGDQA